MIRRFSRGAFAAWTLGAALVGTSVTLPGPAHAAGQLRLEPVWTRLADRYGEAGSVESAEFSPDGRTIVTGNKFDFQVILWRTSDGAELWRRPIPDEIERVGFSPDGRLIAVVSEDWMLRVLNAEDGALVHQFRHDAGIDGLAFSHDGRWLATGEEVTRGADGQSQGKLRLFAMPEFKLAHIADHGATINSIDFRHDDAVVITAGKGAVKAWRTRDLKQVGAFKTFPRPDTSVKWGLVSTRFSPDGELVAGAGFGGDVYVWDAETGDLVRRFDHTGRKIEVVNWTPDGRYLLTAGYTNYIDIWRRSQIEDPDIGHDALPVAHRAWAASWMEYMHFDPTGGLLTTAHQDGTVRLWLFISEDPTLQDRAHAEISARQKTDNERRAAAGKDR